MICFMVQVRKTGIRDILVGIVSSILATAIIALFGHTWHWLHRPETLAYVALGGFGVFVLGGFTLIGHSVSMVVRHWGARPLLWWSEKTHRQFILPVCWTAMSGFVIGFISLVIFRYAFSS